MSDMGDMFREMREVQSQHKRERVTQQQAFIEWLRSISVTWRVLPGGFRFNIVSKSGYHETFDYWPSSGKWFELKPKTRRQGERALRTRLNELRGYHD